ncbi:hypothetical protein E2C01_005293 [Portunus trituberculatus]|uniref:Uncharacterized protein n=1 Tax=Portunus trituberculatus TaxID=210409 RepID=A0A5B7CT48_PORTR|nr:hypothetical protein [Portunus trituberculatus]
MDEHSLPPTTQTTSPQTSGGQEPRAIPVPVLSDDHSPGGESSQPQAGASSPTPQFVNILPNI